MTVIRMLAVLVSGVCFWIAFGIPKDSTDRLMIFLAGVVFGLLAYSSARNKGESWGPYVYLSCAAMTLMYAILGLVSGIYSFRRGVIAWEQDPHLFWGTFFVLSLLGLSTFIYALRKLRD